ncbi:MAG: MFS transporter [Gammaproteobacteria bacterium RIFCSPHIGHO2_12_FULL_42_13]|nr:MAG: MFS transporter [Gammaproteobacteria bacterium RIFCSPHIGHO2_12_FULL_42_13]
MKSTLDRPLQSYHLNFFTLFVAGMAAVAGILFGFDTGVISGAILFVQKLYHLTPFENGVVVSASLIGAVIGAISSGWFADRFGRKRLLLTAAVIFVVGTLGSALAQSVAHLIISRLILGFAIGIASFAAPLYISEIAPPKMRGALVSLNQLAITIGILTSYFVDVYYAELGEWRWMFGVGVIPAVILFLGFLFLPDSPRWLCSVGKTHQAFDVLKRIRKTSHIRAEFAAIRASLEAEGHWKDILKPWLLPAIWIGLGLGFFQQFTGINTVIYYAPTIFQLAGFKSDVAAIMATMGIGAINVIATIVSLFLIDRWGRKPLLYIGMTIMLICLSTLSISFALGTSEVLQWMAFFSMFFYVVGFAISLGPIMWLMFTEIFPLKVRGVATSVMASVQWLFNFIVSLTFLTLVHYLQPSGTFGLYALICLLGIWFVHREVPETKGVSLEQIERNLRRGRAGRDLGLLK